MKLIKTKIKDLLLVKTNIHKDRRGFFKEIEKKIYLIKILYLTASPFQKKTP